MRLTNKWGLPQTLVNLAERDDYSRGAAQLSVTQLINSPKVVLLREKHDAEIEVDVTDQVYSLMGRAMHVVLERGADDQHIVEERLFTEMLGWTISGAIDIQRIVSDGHNGTVVDILDYKLTSAYAVMNTKADWENQLNLYAWLVKRVKNWEINQLQIVAIVRDWSKHNQQSRDGYPERQVVTVPIRLWSYEEQTRYVRERIELHQLARAAWFFSEKLKDCSDEERWARDHKWAVKKPANKKATKVFDSEADAEAFVAAAKPGEFVIEHRPGEPIRCVNNYCNVAPFCAQHARWLADNQGEV